MRRTNCTARNLFSYCDCIGVEEEKGAAINSNATTTNRKARNSNASSSDTMVETHAEILTRLSVLENDMVGMKRNRKERDLQQVSTILLADWYC